jgi:general secretion pathway protein L
MSLLLVYLPSPASPASGEWPFVWSEDGLNPSRQGTAAAALLPKTGRGDEVVAIVPLQALSWHAVELPSHSLRQAGRSQALLEGLLEEHLLSEPQNLHLVLGPSANWVAAVDKAWLQTTLQALEGQGIAVNRIVPEVWPDRVEPGQATTLLAVQGPQQAEWVILRHDSVLRWPLQPEGPTVLPPPWLLTPAWTSDLETSPSALAPALQVLAEPALASAAETASGMQVQLQTAAQRWLLAGSSPWNLAQYSLARSTRDRALRRVVRVGTSLLKNPEWAWARLGLVALVLLQILGLNVQAWRTRQDQAQRQTEMNAWLSSTFPTVQVVVDAPLQMQNELHRLRQKAGEIGPTDLESLLAAVQSGVQGTAAEQHPPQEIEYTSGVLKLKGLTFSPQDFNAFAQRLQAKGLLARQQDGQVVVRSETP